MNAAYFEEQRRDMVAAVRAITDHMAAQLGKTALDERVLGAMVKVPRHYCSAYVCFRGQSRHAEKAQRCRYWG